MHHSGTMRTPAFGIIPGRDSVVVTIEKPMLDHEQPVVVTLQPTVLRVTAMYRTKILVQNDSDQPVGYMMVIVPNQIAKLGRVPWQQLYQILRDPKERQFLWQQVAQRLVQFATNATQINPGKE